MREFPLYGSQANAFHRGASSAARIIVLVTAACTLCACQSLKSASLLSWSRSAPSNAAATESMPQLLASPSCSLAEFAPTQKDAAPFSPAENADLVSKEEDAEIALKAKDYLGVPYRFGGTNLKTGMDCSFLVQHLFQNGRNVLLPRTAMSQHAATHQVAMAEIRQGDLIFFKAKKRRIDHVGVYIGDGFFIHASSHEKRVSMAKLNDPFWRRRIASVARVNQSMLVAHSK